MFTLGRKLLILGVSYWLTVANAFAANSPLEAIFQLNENTPDKTYHATLTLKNNTDQPLTNWELAFTTIRAILHIDEATVQQQIGGYYVIAPTATLQTIPAHQAVTLHLTGKHDIKRYTDAPSGYFVIVTDATTHHTTTYPVIVTTQLPNWQPNEVNSEFTVMSQQAITPIENNPITPAITAENSLLVPLPVAIERHPGHFTLHADTVLLIDPALASTPAAARFLATALKPATGYQLAIKAHSPHLKNYILFAKANSTLSLGAEGYTLEVTPKHIIIRATTEAGFFYGVQSLRQLFPPAIFDAQVAHVSWSVPAVSIQDYPRFAYRGFSLDVARHFIPPDQIKRFLDLMALHKLNRFQWHLTDDEGWRLEIKHYPSLTSVGAWRGYQLTLPPALGSGAKRYGGFYTQQDVRDIVAYAAERHIIIIPEIDVPGHAHALVQSLPEQLIDHDDQSRYSSVANYHDNVLSPCLEKTYAVLDTIFTEVSALFPGDTIHIGSDEVPSTVWMNSPSCQELAKTIPLDTPTAIHRYFLTRVQAIIEAKHKKMAGWEEILLNPTLSPTTTVYSWRNETAGIAAAEKGYPVVMMPAPYLYFDLAYTADPNEPGFAWAGFVDTYRAYSYQPIHSLWPDAIKEHILGIQGALWTENVDSQDKFDYFVFPKLLALAEDAWTPKERRNWQNFAERVGLFHLPRLDHLGVQYRIAPPSIDPLSLRRNTLTATTEFPGMVLRYSPLSTTISHGAVYQHPIPLSTPVNLQTFNATQRGSRVVNLQTE